MALADSCTGVDDALARYAWERASSGHTLSCTLGTLDEFCRTAAIVPDAATGAAMTNTVADAWADAAAAERAAPCVDPLSGLHTLGYLLGRINELDRVHSEPTPLILVMVSWPAKADPWTRMEELIGVADALRALVRLDATLVQLDSGRVAAMVPDDTRARIERRSIQDALPSTEVCVRPVPDDRSALAELIAAQV